MRESVITSLLTLILPSKYKYVVDSIDRMTQIGALKDQNFKRDFLKWFYLPNFEETYHRSEAPFYVSYVYNIWINELPNFLVPVNRNIRKSKVSPQS